MGWLGRLMGGSSHEAEPSVERAIAAGVTADVWDLLIDDSRTKGSTPSMADLEGAYSASDLVYSVCQEIIQAVTKVEISAPLAVKTLLQHPNTVQDWSTFITQFLAALLSTGLGAAIKLPLDSAAVQELHVLKTSSLTREPGTFNDPWRRLSYSDGRNHYPVLQAENLITRINPSPTSPIEPVSPLLSCWQLVQMDIALSTYQHRTLDRLPYLVGVVETEDTTTKSQRDTLQQSLKQILGGDTLVMPQGAHILAPALSGGDSITLPGLGEHAESRVCAAYNVPPELVGILAGRAHATFSNYGEARASFHDETILPILAQLSDAFSRGLGVEVEFTLAAPDIAGDSPTAEAEQHKAAAGVQ